MKTLLLTLSLIIGLNSYGSVTTNKEYIEMSKKVELLSKVVQAQSVLNIFNKNIKTNLELLEKVEYMLIEVEYEGEDTKVDVKELKLLETTLTLSLELFRLGIKMIEEGGNPSEVSESIINLIEKITLK